MDLVIDKVMQFQHVDVAHRDLTVELGSSASIIQRTLAGGVQLGLFKHGDHIRFPRTVKHRCCHRHTAFQVVGKPDYGIVIQIDDIVILCVLAINIFQNSTQRFDITGFLILTNLFADLQSKSCTGPAKMGFQNLADIHPAWHAKWVENDVDLGAIFQIGHVFNRNNARDHTLVAVTSGHFVTGLKLALHGDKHFDHFHHAGRQLITALQLVDLVEEACFKLLAAVIILLFQSFQFAHQLVVFDRQQPPL